MNNVFELQERLERLTQSAEIAKLDENSRIEFAKLSIAFGELADYIEVVDAPKGSAIKASDIALYQKRIQDLLESINTSLANIEAKIKPQ